MNLKEKQGITLIALIITIIVLLILAGVSIVTLAGDNGILTRTKSAKKTSEISVIKEEIKTEIIAEQAKNEGKVSEDALKAILENHGIINYDDDGKTIKSITTKEGYEIAMPDIWTGIAIKKTISKTKSYVGCYADIDADGTVDGVIYADLAKGHSNTGLGENYEIPTVTEGLKDYYVSKTNYKYNEGFGTKDVISPTGTGGSKDRFYIMALEDFNKGTYYDWYNAAYGNIDSSITNTEFGAGKTNTTTMITKWNAKAYGDQDKCRLGNKDMWGQIQTKVNAGWFVPSKAEWAAFAGELGISKDSSNERYFGNFGLCFHYWSSSLNSTSRAWCADIGNGCMYDYGIDDTRYVRLSATF